MGTLNHGHVRIHTWGACSNDTEVVLYLMENWGHVWPGRYFTAELEEEDPLKDFDAAEVIWNFFKSHTRKPYGLDLIRIVLHPPLNDNPGGRTQDNFSMVVSGEIHYEMK